MATTFDPAALAALLKKAQGTKTQCQFAKEIGMSDSHYNRLVRMNRKVPPTIQSLNRIAQVSTEVSLSELLSVCGYEVENARCSSLDTPHALSNHMTKKYTSILLSVLESLPYEWTLKKDSPLFPLSVAFTNGPIKNMHFIYVEDVSPKTLPRLLIPIYYQLLFLRLEEGTQVFFVTRKEELYKALTSQKPVNLSLSLSALLLNEEHFEIAKEETLTNQAKLFFTL